MIRYFENHLMDSGYWRFVWPFLFALVYLAVFFEVFWIFFYPTLEQRLNPGIDPGLFPFFGGLHLLYAFFLTVTLRQKKWGVWGAALIGAGLSLSGAIIDYPEGSFFLVALPLIYASSQSEEIFDSMVLSSVDRSSGIAFHVNEHEHSDLNVSVEVKDGWFQGTITTWIKQADLEAFIDQLVMCEEIRQGSATLVSMSPDDLELTLESSDSIGHFRVRYKITGYSFVGEDSLPRVLMGGFSLDSEYFAQIVADFRQLANSPGSPHP